MNIMHKWSQLLCLGIICLIMTACSNENSEPLPPSEYTRTVLIYMAADNSLSGLERSDINELKTGMAALGTTNVHLLVYVDNKSQKPQLVEYTAVNGQVTENVIKTYEARNSVGVDETREVFNDVFGDSRFKANSYGLVYWSHGDGWIPNPLPSTRWIGQDTGNGTYYMNLSDLTSILDSAPHFDFILFDACFMFSVEVGYELRQYTDYILGSPTETPGPGAPYDKIVPYMFADNAVIPMAQAYFKAYNDIYNGGQGITNNNWTGGTAIGVMKTSELEALAQATSALCTDALSAGTAGTADLTSIFNYDKRSPSSSLYVGYYDMVELAQALAPSETSFNAWKQAYDAALAYWQTTPKNYSSVCGMFSMERANGLSHYLPQANRASAARAYRTTAWYQAAGLGALGF